MFSRITPDFFAKISYSGSTPSPLTKSSKHWLPRAPNGGIERAAVSGGGNVPKGAGALSYDVMRFSSSLTPRIRYGETYYIGAGVKYEKIFTSYERIRHQAPIIQISYRRRTADTPSGILNTQSVLSQFAKKRLQRRIKILNYLPNISLNMKVVPKPLLALTKSTLHHAPCTPHISNVYAIGGIPCQIAIWETV